MIPSCGGRRGHLPSIVNQRRGGKLSIHGTEPLGHADCRLERAAENAVDEHADQRQFNETGDFG
jgi:hypothetical protein